MPSPAGLVVSKGSPMCSTTCGAIPDPVSRTASVTSVAGSSLRSETARVIGASQESASWAINDGAAAVHLFAYQDHIVAAAARLAVAGIGHVFELAARQGNGAERGGELVRHPGSEGGDAGETFFAMGAPD